MGIKLLFVYKIKIYILSIFFTIKYANERERERENMKLGAITLHRSGNCLMYIFYTS